MPLADKSRPLVSIILPNYNHADFLEDRIQSVLDQSCQDFELILLDDGSSDHSLELLRRYKGHPKVTHIYTRDMNSGSPFIQWNQGIRLAAGRFVWIAESDDRANPDFLQSMVGLLENHLTVGLAYCQSYEICQSGYLSGDLSWLVDSIAGGPWHDDFVMSGKQYIRDYMFERNTIPNVSACLFRAEALAAAGPAPESFKYNGDWFYYCKVLHDWDIAFNKDCLNYFRSHANTSRHHESAETRRRAMIELFVILRYLRDHFDLDRERFHQSKKKFSGFRLPLLDELEERLLLLNPPTMAIYGAGILGKQLWQRLVEKGWSGRVSVFIDKKAEKYAVPDIDGTKVLSLNEYKKIDTNRPVVVASQHFAEEICDELSKANIKNVISSQADLLYQQEGFCFCCNSKTTFATRDAWLRDHFLCGHCGSIPRQRALMYCLEKYCPGWKQAVIHESSPEPGGASKRISTDCQQYIATQYFRDIDPGDEHEGYRCENLESLTFVNNSIDIHITQDVMEHVFHPAMVFKEIERTLRSGGFYVFTVPLVNKLKATVRCAELVEGKILHYAPPEYHGNPIDDEGSLVTMNWGYDIVDFIHNHCGLLARIIDVDNLEYGIRAEFNEVIICHKSAT